jgi:hypothetical protein
MQRGRDGVRFFRPQFLGDKFPAVDHYVELLGGDDELTPFFFVQVKTTTLGYTGHGMLRVQVSETGMKRLRAYPAPTNIIGVEEPQEALFLIAAVDGGPTHFPSLPTTHRIDASLLRELYDEVVHFWRSHDTRFTSSRFR